MEKIEDGTTRFVETRENEYRIDLHASDLPPRWILEATQAAREAAEPKIQKVIELTPGESGSQQIAGNGRKVITLLRNPELTASEGEQLLAA